MEYEPYRILWVSKAQSVPASVQHITQGQTARPIQISVAAPHDMAIHALRQGKPDAVLVANDFDSLSILEFVHHARLLNGQVPVIVLSEAYDAALDYKSCKLGASACITMDELDGEFLQHLLKSQPEAEVSARSARQKAVSRKPFLQFPALFK